MSTPLPPPVASASSVAAETHRERAQDVWRAAVELAGETARGGSGGTLELLRLADFDPSTLRHALTLGHTRLRRRPSDARLLSGRRLLQAATDWLGSPAGDNEVGAAGRAPAPSRSLRPGSGS